MSRLTAPAGRGYAKPFGTDYMEEEDFLRQANLGIIIVTVRGQENVYGTIDGREVYTKPGHVEGFMKKINQLPEHDECPMCKCARTRAAKSFFMICPQCDGPSANNNPRNN